MHSQLSTLRSQRQIYKMNKMNTIKLGRLEESIYYHREDVEKESDDEEETEFIGGTGTEEHREHCKNCPSCVYLLLIEYNMLTNTFKYIGLAYQYLLTLSVTQVACERSFSTLKLIKTHMRNMLSQDNLEGLC